MKLKHLPTTPSKKATKLTPIKLSVFEHSPIAIAVAIAIANARNPFENYGTNESLCASEKRENGGSINVII